MLLSAAMRGFRRYALLPLAFLAVFLASSLGDAQAGRLVPLAKRVGVKASATAKRMATKLAQRAKGLNDRRPRSVQRRQNRAMRGAMMNREVASSTGNETERLRQRVGRETTGRQEGPRRSLSFRPR